jgi:putative oxidoreductase
MLERVCGWITRLPEIADSLRWLPPLLMRVFVGYFFFEDGWFKIHHLDLMTQRFAGWGVPHPALNAAVSGYTECIGGALTAVGLFTRIVSIPMFINMLVATLAVKIRELTNINGFFELDEPLYALVFVWLLIAGPGAVSVDSLIKRLLHIKQFPEDSLGGPS